jgi:bifunctional DNA-binding transcriptional regulator/antitoxin component of YhaV-PrlF toxin-antitoxin module
LKSTGLVRHVDETGRVVVPVEWRRENGIFEQVTPMEISADEEGLIKVNEHFEGIAIVRKLDHLGRIVIPSEIRRTQGIVHNTEMEILLDDNAVYFRKRARSCRLCSEDIANKVKFPFREHLICGSCMTELNAGVYAE